MAVDTRIEALEAEVRTCGKLPQHLAIIMDGNGRWAQQRRLPRIAGHTSSRETVRRVVRLCARLGNARPATRGRTEPSRQQSPAHRRVEEVLRKRLGTDVSVTARRKGRGTIGISYYNEDDLTRLLELILGAPYDG